MGIGTVDTGEEEEGQEGTTQPVTLFHHPLGQRIYHHNAVTIETIIETRPMLAM